MTNQRYVVLDTETTGFKPDEGHRIIEIGAVELQGFQKGKEYQQYINPLRDVPQASFQVHGLSEKFLKNKPLFVDVVDDFLNFIGDATLLIHNSDFDLAFINHHLAELGYGALTNPVIDTVMVARKKFPGQSNSLDALCRRFDISLEERQQHGALKDCLLLVDVWLELNGGRQASLNLENQGANKKPNNQVGNQISAGGPAPQKQFESNQIIVNHQQDRPQVSNNNSPRPARLFAASAEELKQHQELLAQKIPNNLWGAVQ